MSFKSTKIVNVKSAKEFNELLKFCKENRHYSPSDYYSLSQDLPSMYYQIEEKLIKIQLKFSTRAGGYKIYEFHLDGSEERDHTTGMKAFNLLQRMSGKAIIDLRGNSEWYDKDKEEWKLATISGLIWFNPKFNNQRFENCYGYDKNSSYSSAMLGPIPDTSVEPRRNGLVEKGEIGFREMAYGKTDETYLYAVFEKGKYAEWIFPAIESPFKDFVNKYYNAKRDAKDKNERQYYKDILNYSVGYIRRKNPFIHSCILSRARYSIESLIDKDTLYCNTDSIISKVERKDIEENLGNEVGQFKIEHNESFAYNDSGYQWGFSVPSIRGKSKQWFKNKYPNGFDILKDDLPYTEANKYYYDRKKMRICVNTIDTSS